MSLFHPFRSPPYRLSLRTARGKSPVLTHRIAVTEFSALAAGTFADSLFVLLYQPGGVTH